MSGVVDGVFAVSLPSVDSLFESSLALAVTSVLSFTLSSGIVITPVFSSTVTSDPSGTVHLPSSPFVAVTVLSFPSLSLYVTVTVFVSASVGGVTVTEPSSFASNVGAAGGVVSGVSGFAFAVAVIVALSAVIGVPAGVDHVGFSYPPFAVTCGYLSAVNAVPSFTSYTLLFVISFTPSPFVNVTLTYPSGVGLSSLPVLSIMSGKVA